MPDTRILHFPTDVGGHPVALSHGERAHEADSEVAVLRRSWLRYPVDIDLGAKPDSKWSDLAHRLRFFGKAVRRYDVFHFNFGQTFLPMVGGRGVDLPLLRKLGKKVFVTFQGCDARQHSYCAANFAISCCGNREGPGLCNPADDARKARRIEFVRKHAHRVFAVNPDLLHVIPDADFVPYAAVKPQDVEVRPPKASGRMTVLHAPTNRLVKGTDDVLAAMASIERECDVDFRLVENVPHDEAMAMYRDADLVIDQLRVGWYGAFAVELMAMGKPVVAYVREEDLRFIPEAMAEELPIVRATPDDVHDIVGELLENPERLADIGRRSRTFVERWHDPRTIAERMLRVYDAPDRGYWQ